MNCQHALLSNDYEGFITDFPVEEIRQLALDVCIVNIDDTYNIVYLTRENLAALEETTTNYQNVPNLYGLMQNEQISSAFFPGSLIASGITQIQRPPLGLTGQGVIICIIDTGINYTNPAFLDASGNTRIQAIWDQTIQDGPPPDGYFFGTEYTREDINRALQSSDPYSIVPSRDENSHGSILAGVAAGSRVNSGLQYLGAAPDADLVIVKLKECPPYLRDYYVIPDNVPAYSEADIMMAVRYADSFATVFTRPVVICLGLGTNIGDHAGSSPLSRYLSNISIRRSRAVVVCGGNEGNAAHHFHGQLSQNSDGSGSYRDVEIRVSEGSMGFYLELWGSPPDLFNVEIRSPGGERISPIRLGLQANLNYGFVYDRTRIIINSVLVEAASGDELIQFRVHDPTPGIWTFRVLSPGTVHRGEFHMWLPIKEFLNTPVYFLESDPYITLTEPAMASGIISVSTYNADNNSFYSESGRGFSRTGAIRPDLAAPGVNVSTIYGSSTGSSLAAGITAGAAAQFMQWAVIEGNSDVAESRELKNYLIRGAERSPDMLYPNREWGYGRLSMTGTFDALVGI